MRLQRTDLFASIIHTHALADTTSQTDTSYISLAPLDMLWISIIVCGQIDRYSLWGQSGWRSASQQTASSVLVKVCQTTDSVHRCCRPRPLAHLSMPSCLHVHSFHAVQRIDGNAISMLTVSRCTYTWSIRTLSESMFNAHSIANMCTHEQHPSK